MSAAPEAREAIARAACDSVSHSAIYDTLSDTAAVMGMLEVKDDWRVNVADPILAVLRSLPLPARLRAIGLDPETLAVVPRVATNRMCAAGGPEVRKAAGVQKGKGDMQTIWSAMLAAADAEGAR